MQTSLNFFNFNFGVLLVSLNTHFRTEILGLSLVTLILNEFFCFSVEINLYMELIFICILYQTVLNLFCRY